MSMKAFNTTPLMRSGNLQANLGLNSLDYNQVTISLKNPTTEMAIQDFIFILQELLLFHVIMFFQLILP